ncbi:type I toxin-antitoxin system Fst family toxin [Selenomonas ruminantium]
MTLLKENFITRVLIPLLVGILVELFGHWLNH